MNNNATHIELSPIRLKDHITHKSGKRKTVCVSAVLTALGVPLNSFHYTGKIGDGKRSAILNRNGFACRSRLSKVGKNTSIGQARKKITKLNEGSNVKYMIVVSYGRSAHLMLLDHEGKTLVDTDPRKVDKRRIQEIHAVFKNN
jgi:hypothetical protein